MEDQRRGCICARTRTVAGPMPVCDPGLSITFRDHVIRRRVNLCILGLLPLLVIPVSSGPDPSCLNHSFWSCQLAHITPDSLPFLTYFSMNYAEAAALRRLAAQQPRRRAARPRSTLLAPSELPRPPPKTMPDPVTYDKVARPRAYYQRPVTKRDLPVMSVSYPVPFCDRKNCFTCSIHRVDGPH